MSINVESTHYFRLLASISVVSWGLEVTDPRDPFPTMELGWRFWGCALYLAIAALTPEIPQVLQGLHLKFAVYRSPWALRAQNRKKKISKMSEKSPKISQKVPKCLKKSNFQIFGHFGTFWGVFGDFPKRPFLRCFWDFGPGGPGDSCKWRLGSQC